MQICLAPICKSNNGAKKRTLQKVEVLQRCKNCTRGGEGLETRRRSHGHGRARRRNFSGRQRKEPLQTNLRAPSPGVLALERCWKAVRAKAACLDLHEQHLLHHSPAMLNKITYGGERDGGGGGGGSGGIEVPATAAPAAMASDWAKTTAAIALKAAGSPKCQPSRVAISLQAAKNVPACMR